MKEFTTDLISSKDDQHFLVLWQHESGSKQYVVCSYYNRMKPVGEQWTWGHYFENIKDALAYWDENNY